MLAKLKGVDLFPQGKADLYKRTLSGGVLSIICFFIVFILFFSELSSYWETKIETDLVVDVNRNDPLNIHFDITFPSLPCAYLSIDAVDVSGKSHYDISANIEQIRLHPSGKEVTREEDARLRSTTLQNITQYPIPKNSNGCESCYGAESEEVRCCVSCVEVQSAYRRKGWAFVGTNTIQCWNEGFVPLLEAQSHEGCRLNGKLYVNKVAGNFHISPGKSVNSVHGHSHTTYEFKTDTFNMSHVINSLSFGEKVQSLSNPLDQMVNIIDAKQSVYQYYLKVVSTSYTDINGASMNASQYSVTQYYQTIDNTDDSHDSHGHPGVFFIYELSPIQVIMTERQKSFAEFFTSICAIVGGVFALFRILDQFVYQGVKSIRKKQEIGKIY